MQFRTTPAAAHGSVSARGAALFQSKAKNHTDMKHLNVIGCDSCPFSRYTGGIDECCHPERPDSLDGIPTEDGGRRLEGCPLEQGPTKATRQKAPWRKVVRKLALRAGRGSVLGPSTSRRTRWWELELECGHVVERTVRYSPAKNPKRGGTQHRSRSDVLPHPKKVRCEYCPDGG